MNVDWEKCNDVYELGQILVHKGVFDAEFWRRFHCLCYRRVWEFVLEKRARQAIEVAERYCLGAASVDQLVDHHRQISEAVDRAWTRVKSLRIGSDRSSWIWPVSEEVDNAWVAYESFSCGKVATDKNLDSSTIPDAASSLRAWATARREAAANGVKTSMPDRSAVEQSWKRIRDAEEEAQAELLRSLIGKSRFQ
jgi:hypothetical protein